MKGSHLAIELFGEDFVDHYTRTRDWESKAYKKFTKGKNPKEITPWELRRYFEII
jgi:glutamine synthetase